MHTVEEYLLDKKLVMGVPIFHSLVNSHPKTMIPWNKFSVTYIVNFW